MKQDKIALLTPIRGRRKLLEEMLESWRANTQGNSVMILGVDSDDATYDSIKHKHQDVIWDVGQPGTSLQVLNRLALKYKDEFSYLMFMEDDVIFTNPHWESKYLTALKQHKLALVFEYLNEPTFPKLLPGLPCVHSEFVDVLGYFAVPTLQFLAADNAWDDIMRATQIGVELPHENFVHKHFSTGLSDRDETAERVQAQLGPDIQRYQEWKRTQFKDDVRKVIEKLVELGER